MEDSLDEVSADGWHPQDVILVGQALQQFVENDDMSDARKTRAYALVFKLIDTADIPYEHTDFDGYEHLPEFGDRALFDWMENQTDPSWGEDLVPE